MDRKLPDRGRRLGIDDRVAKAGLAREVAHLGEQPGAVARLRRIEARLTVPRSGQVELLLDGEFEGGGPDFPGDDGSPRGEGRKPPERAKGEERQEQQLLAQEPAEEKGAQGADHEVVGLSAPGLKVKIIRKVANCPRDGWGRNSRVSIDGSFSSTP